MFRTPSDVTAQAAGVQSWLWAHAAPIFFFALLTAVTARLAFPLPFTPVPITLQVWAVLLSGLVLGSRGGALSQATYLAALLAGLPISTTGLGGPGVLLGPTGGYLLAFPVGAWLAGRVIEALPHSGRLGLAVHLVAGLGGVFAIYIGGVAWLTVLLGDFGAAVRQGALPFVAVDLLKALFAALAAGGGRILLRAHLL
jgi:biotin transport system substrate-specific component